MYMECILKCPVLSRYFPLDSTLMQNKITFLCTLLLILFLRCCPFSHYCQIPDFSDFLKKMVCFCHFIPPRLHRPRVFLFHNMRYFSYCSDNFSPYNRHVILFQNVLFQLPSFCHRSNSLLPQPLSYPAGNRLRERSWSLRSVM